MSKVQTLLTYVQNQKANFGKWQSIKLTNDVKELTVSELAELSPLIQQARLELLQSTLQLYVSKQAPDIIVANVQKMIDKCKSGKDPVTRIVERELQTRTI